MLVQCWPSVETGQERYGVRNDGNVGPRPPEGRTYCERQSSRHNDFSYFGYMRIFSVCSCAHLALNCINPLSPHDALKHHFTSLKTDLIFPQQQVLERKFP